MLSGQDLVMIALGILTCFAGYSMFRSMLPLWGFLLGGWIAYTLLPGFVSGAQAGELLYQIGAFVVGGLIGAAISVPLYFVLIFLSGGALGMFLGIVVGALLDVGGISSVQQVTNFTAMSFPPLPHSGTQFILMLVFGLIMGGLAIIFQQFMVSASSAFLGSAAVFTGLTGTIALANNSAMGRSAVMMVGWMILSLVGLFVQFRMQGEV